MSTSTLSRTTGLHAAPAAGSRRRGPACASSPEVFQDVLVEDPPRGALTREDRDRQTRLLGQARATCEACPLRAACLYDAVVRHDVSGFVAGTTVRQRGEIRRRLGIVVEHEDLDTLAGVVGGTRQVDHDEVLRLRRANPDETLEQLAHRLGCSLSTVKRHLRRERHEPTVRITTSRPMPAQVLQVTATVVSGTANVRRAA
ncbi:winged helix-turn-helix domain-containing protein [Microlunatus flavus]|uniref:Sigma-70, region 4 n=1 Tax=Microlunatus flavus TaxID=1036181 RepID=A0A1H9ADP6_9ACTN|nr:WhiB family transcriptional regulator [Microlunatus flavus]SEP74553.1 Sigma-70, region 4 [Microlunatus flavus]